MLNKEEQEAKVSKIEAHLCRMLSQEQEAEVNNLESRRSKNNPEVRLEHEAIGKTAQRK